MIKCKQKRARGRPVLREDKKLAQQIRALRQERGMTQEELSGRLGLSLTYIAQVETYQKCLSLPVVYKIANIFGVKVRDLYTF